MVKEFVLCDRYGNKIQWVQRVPLCHVLDQETGTVYEVAIFGLEADGRVSASLRAVGQAKK